MNLFSRQICSDSSVEASEKIPIHSIDLSRRYDIYCTSPREERLYEDMRFVSIRTFERKQHDYGTALLGGYLEIEARDGTRLLIASHQVRMLCEHGSHPKYRGLRTFAKDESA